MKTFTLYEGRTPNDNDMVTDFRNRAKALKAFAKSEYPFAVVMEYDGTKDDPQAYYRDTLAQKGA